METHHHDKVFFVTFAGVLGFLVAFTLAIIWIANVVAAQDEPDEIALARIEERITPAGKVITDPAALLAVAEPAAEKREPMSGPDVVARVCAACHQTGVLQAPKIGDAGTWGKLKGSLGLDGLTQSAIKGKNQMPAKGGDASLTEDEIRAAISEMLKQSGV